MRAQNRRAAVGGNVLSYIYMYFKAAKCSLAASPRQRECQEKGGARLARTRRREPGGAIPSARGSLARAGSASQVAQYSTVQKGALLFPRKRNSASASQDLCRGPASAAASTSTVPNREQLRLFYASAAPRQAPAGGACAVACGPCERVPRAEVVQYSECTR